MNYDEMLNAREGGTQGIVELPLGALYKKKIEGKYHNVIELKPDLAEAYYNRGLMYLRMGNKNMGVADLSKAGELGVLPSYNVLKRMTH